MKSNYSCRICGISFVSRQRMAGHTSVHSRKVKLLQINVSHLCRFCGREFSTGVQLGGHTASCPKNPNRSETLKKISRASLGHKHSNEVKRMLSKRFLEQFAKGRVCSGGKGHRESYVSVAAGEVLLKSTWESWIARWLDERNIPWEYEKIHVPYVGTDGKQHTYFVDFHRLDLGGKYCIECKNYNSKEWLLKKQAFATVYPHMHLKVVMLEQLQDFKLRTWKVLWLNGVPNFVKV